MNNYGYYKYLKISNEKLFTLILLPQSKGNFPTVVFRTPYVSHTVNKLENELLESALSSFKTWLERGYAIVYQHCKGTGKSSGEFVPYIHEREDGLELRKWIRSQPFYNGEIYLCGGSYGASLHYSTSPFESDVKGAVLEIQDSERYNLWYRNGQMRKGHANWHFGLYKANCGLNKTFSYSSFSELPLKNLSERVLGERAEDFEQMLNSPNPSDEFWNTRFGGSDAKDAVVGANIPILLTTGYNDFYVGGVFDMWNAIDAQTKEKSALLISPYNHGDGYCSENGLCFENATRGEQFGSAYSVDWFDNIRKGTPLSFKKGVITYYRTFENRWESDFYSPKIKPCKLPLGDEVLSFEYNPLNPTAFSCEGQFANEQPKNNNYISLLTKPFSEDKFIKGKIKALLTVSSNCEDTSFYVRISLKSLDFTYVLRHDITSLCYQLGDYTKNAVVQLDFSFDEYAFLLKAGDVLQVDIASTDNNTYVVHTNLKGDYHLQDHTETAVNKVYLDKSYILLPVEEK